MLIACVVFFVSIHRSENRLTRLAGLAAAFALAGLLLGGNRLVGYSLVSVGVMLGIASLFLQALRA